MFKNNNYPAILAVLIVLNGCASDKEVASNTAEEYLQNTSITQKNGSHTYDEYVVKAVMIDKIIAATTWTDGKKTKINLCVIGNNNFHGRLEKVADFIKKEGREWNIKHGIQPSDVKHCDVLYAGFIYSDHELRQYLNEASKHPVLTIGEDKNFGFYGGMITLKTTQDNHIAINLNLEAAQKAGFKFDKELIEAASN